MTDDSRTLPNRRAFTVALLAGIASATAWGLYSSLGPSRHSHDETPSEPSHHPAVKRLRAHFDGVDFDDASLRKYVQEYSRYIHVIDDRFHYPDDFFTRYLLSTNFFDDNRHQGAPIRYRGLYHPYVNPCGNPLHQRA